MWLNYQHLYYFWIVAREPSLTSAAQRLKLSPSTVSTQIKALEERVGQALFDRRGRGLTLTERGRVALAYADDIFSLGEELIDSIQSKAGHPNHIYRFRVGVSHHLPKLIASSLLEPTVQCEDFPIHLVCLQGDANELVADLAVHHFDLVLSDQPVSLSSEQPIESLLLGECEVSLMGTKQLVEEYQQHFPHSLQNAPLLLPAQDSQMRKLLEDYFHTHSIHPHVVAEFADSALLKSFGQEGVGLFPIPSVVADEVAKQYQVEEVGRLSGVRERFYIAFTAGREENPAVKAVLNRAHSFFKQPDVSPS